MANTWLRLWHDMPNDPKWRTISRISGQPLPLVQATYIHLLVSASQNVTRGHTDVTNEDLASALDVTEDEISSVINAMQGRVLDGSYVSGWERRQVKKEEGQNPESLAMTAAERKRKQRERERLRRNEEVEINGVTCGHEKSRKVTPDKDKDKDKDKDTDLNKHIFEEAWLNYPKRSGSNPKNKAFESWKARLEDGVDPAEMLAGVRRYREHCDAGRLTGTKFVMQALRFFGAEREFEAQWNESFNPLTSDIKPDSKIPNGFRGYKPDITET